MRHIFVYVLDRADDPFAGIKSCLLNKEQNSSIIDIRLAPEDYECIHRVEYTWRRFVRFLYYGAVYRTLIKKIKGALSSQEENIVYMSDEGVWGVFLNRMCRNLEKDFLSVNVQHGFFDLSFSEKPYRLRRITNRFFYPFLKGPVYGYGFGGGNFDIYLCYGSSEVDYLKGMGHRDVFACPKLIKWKLIQTYMSMDVSKDISNIAFILPTAVPGSGFACSLSEFLHVIEPLVRYLITKHGCRVTLRKHPGGNAEQEDAAILSSPLAGLVEIDQEENIIYTFAKNPIIFSAHSTALFEAQLLGRCAIGVSTRCYGQPIHYLRRMIDLRQPDWKEKIDGYLARYGGDGNEGKMESSETCFFLEIIYRKLSNSAPEGKHNERA